MSVMSIRIDNNKRKILKIIASVEEKTMGGIVSSLIEDYIAENKEKITKLPETENLNSIVGLSEFSFMEWDNEEDEIYDHPCCG
jgi:hypothetical protein